VPREPRFRPTRRLNWNQGSLGERSGNDLLPRQIRRRVSCIAMPPPQSPAAQRGDRVHSPLCLVSRRSRQRHVQTMAIEPARRRWLRRPPQRRKSARRRRPARISAFLSAFVATRISIQIHSGGRIAGFELTAFMKLRSARLAILCMNLEALAPQSMKWRHRIKGGRIMNVSSVSSLKK
jgi:hypothetical protein